MTGVIGLKVVSMVASVRSKGGAYAHRGPVCKLRKRSLFWCKNAAILSPSRAWPRPAVPFEGLLSVSVLFSV
jgi:hypothetical protein